MPAKTAVKTLHMLRMYQRVRGQARSYKGSYRGNFDAGPTTLTASGRIGIGMDAGNAGVTWRKASAPSQLHSACTPQNL